MNCDVGKATEGLENELRHRWSNGKAGEWELILQLFRHFTYVTAHSPTLPSLYLRQSSFSNPSVALPTSQLILQPFCHFTYVTAHSPTLPSLYLHHSSFSNPSVASPTSQLILQPFFSFYITCSWIMSPGEPPMAYNCVSSSIFELVGYSPVGYHFLTFRRKLCSAFSRIIYYLTDTENWAVCHLYLSCNSGAFLAQSITLRLFVAVLSSSSSSWVFCPRAGPPLQAKEPRLQFCRRQVFHHILRNQGCSFTRDWLGAVASRCFPHPTLYLFSIWTDLKRSEKNPGAPTWRWGEWIWLTGSFRTSPKFTTGVKYQFHQGFWPDKRSGNPNYPSPPVAVYRLY